MNEAVTFAILHLPVLCPKDRFPWQKSFAAHEQFATFAACPPFTADNRETAP